MSSFWLEYIQDGQRREFSFDATSVSVGRDKSADFVVDHPTVSRQHALIVAAAHGHQLVVLSRGGLTAIDGTQVAGEVDLYDGSEIHFGQLSFTFRSHSAPRKPAANGQTGWNQSGNFASQPAMGQQGYPQQPQMGASPQQNPSFGHGTGAMPASGGYPAPESSGAFGQVDGFGSAARQQPGSQTHNQPQQYNHPQKQSESWDAGWGDPGDENLVSWDQIAQAADEEGNGGASKAETDFARIQAAQARAEAQSKGNPLVKVVGIVGIVGLLAFVFWPQDKASIGPEGNVIDPEKPFIDWQKGDIDCVGKAPCEAAAVAAYNVGVKTWEQKGADITNLFESYRQFDRATKLLEKGGIAALPAEMGDVEQRKLEALGEMETIFQQYRVKYHNLNKRRMYQDMASVLRETRAYFPDKRAKYHQWAVTKEREMKDEGVYPRSSYMGAP